MRLKLILAYEGTRYSGWQIQEKPNPPPTVQGAVETALFALVGQRIRVFGAGRTDSGVHALGQVAHCDLPERNWDWRQRLNAVLPRDIRVVLAEACSPEFHARKDATSKTYRYQFWQEPAFIPPGLRNQVWQTGKLDVTAIRQGLTLFLGEQDFASFQNSGTILKSTVRTLQKIALLEIAQNDFSCLPLLRLEITGNGFLKQMVRNIAGFLAAIGRHKLSWNDLAGILTAKKRASLPSVTAPGCGLFLVRAGYD